MGVEDILQAVVERIPAPVGDENAPLQALISILSSIHSVVSLHILRLLTE